MCKVLGKFCINVVLSVKLVTRVFWKKKELLNEVYIYNRCSKILNADCLPNSADLDQIDQGLPCLLL